jgi:hypothetical protein
MRPSARAEEQLRDQATALALALDREFDRAEAVLWILATSTALARSGLETFETEMRAASARRGSGPIALTTPDVPMATQRGSRMTSASGPGPWLPRTAC